MLGLRCFRDYRLNKVVEVRGHRLDDLRAIQRCRALRCQLPGLLPRENPTQREVPRDQEHCVDAVIHHGVQRRAGTLPLVHHHVRLPHDRLRPDYPCPRHVPHELGYVVVGRQRYDLLRRTLLDDLPVPHDGDAVTDFESFVQVVRDEDNGLVKFRLKGDELVLHLPSYERVKAAERLVHEQYVGVHRQRPRKSDPLLHPAAHLPGVVVFPALQTHGLDGLRRRVVPVLFFHASYL